MTSNVWISLENRNATSSSHLAKLATVYLEANNVFYYSNYYFLIHFEKWSLDSFEQAEAALQVGSEPPNGHDLWDVNSVSFAMVVQTKNIDFYWLTLWLQMHPRRKENM